MIPFVKCHSTPRHTIRVRQNVANTCANHCNQAITLKNGDWQRDIGLITAILKPTAVNCFWRLIDGVDVESSPSRCRLSVKRLRRVYPRTKGYSCVSGFMEELPTIRLGMWPKGGSYQYKRAPSQLRVCSPRHRVAHIRRDSMELYNRPRNYQCDVILLFPGGKLPDCSDDYLEK